MKTASHLAMFHWLLWREIVLAWRRKSDVMSMLAFFVIIASLFPLGLDPDPSPAKHRAGRRVGFGLMASMLGPDACSPDYTDGTLEQMLITPQPAP
jgi:heme exporter protein B